VGGRRFAARLVLMWAACALASEPSVAEPAGIAWSVQGTWRDGGSGSPIFSGDAIEPGALLRPGSDVGGHSITVLLPDGQRILDECFTPEDCARGFRVPVLTQAPDQFAVTTLAAVRSELATTNRNTGMTQDLLPQPRLARDETVAELQEGNQIQIAGLASRLPDGRYKCDLRPLDSAYPRQPRIVIDKAGSAIQLKVPAPGLYRLIITDERDNPRIDVFVAALTPAYAVSVTKSFDDVTALLKRWNLSYYNWPVHEFQRAYLESVVAGLRPANDLAPRAMAHGQLVAMRAREGKVTGEPVFSPPAGRLSGSAAISLGCRAPRCTMHYTMDGSQPTMSSPVFKSPIMVKGSGLTIKAFASAVGRRDSAVVTANYRIAH